MRIEFIGISGLSGSGKTSAANAIAAKKGGKCLLVSCDRYYANPPAGWAPEQIAARNYDHPENIDSALLAEHLQALKEGKPVDMPQYCFLTHKRKTETTRVDPKDIDTIIVEGILVLHFPELQDMFNIRIFVDAPKDICLMRRVMRDMAERGRSVEQVFTQYGETVRPMLQKFISPSKNTADVILTNSNAHYSTAPKLEMEAVFSLLENMKTNNYMKSPLIRLSLMPMPKDEKEIYTYELDSDEELTSEVEFTV